MAADNDKDINNLSEDDDDSEDEDFVPGVESDVSEEEGDGEPEDEEQLNSKGSRKRTSKGSKGVKRKKSKKNVVEFDQIPIESSPDEEDPEKKLRDEEAERERNNKIYADFLVSVDEYSKNKNLGSEVKTEQKVTKVYEFAGEIVKVNETASKSSKNGTSSSQNGNSDKKGTPSKLPFLGARGSGPQPRRHGISFLSGDPASIGLGSSNGKKGGGGISAVLSALQAKKQKIGTLQKSKMDWESFKKQEGIEEELSTHVKGKEGYLERQEFLNRADYRQFEMERDMRAKSRKSL